MAEPFRFREDDILDILKKYIAGTYEEYYVGQNEKIQTVEFIHDQLGSTDFLKANIIKYTTRLRKKPIDPEKDLKKLLHYAILLYYFEFMKNETPLGNK